MKKSRRETGYQSPFFHRCSLCAAGDMLMGVAAVLSPAGGGGVDSTNTLLQGMSRTLQLSVDVCNNLLSFTFVLAAFFTDRRQIRAGTIVFPVVTIITIWTLTPLVHVDTLLHHVLFCMAGTGIIAMSTALSIYAGCGKNPYDCITLGLMKRTDFSYPMIRWILDGGTLVSSMVLYGIYGVVTITNSLMLGRLITTVLSLLKWLKWLRRTMNIEEEILLRSRYSKHFLVTFYGAVLLQLVSVKGNMIKTDAACPQVTLVSIQGA